LILAVALTFFTLPSCAQDPAGKTKQAEGVKEAGEPAIEKPELSPKAVERPEETAPAEEIKKFVFNDFSDPDLRNNVGGETGTWEMDPEDANQYCRAFRDTVNTRVNGDPVLRLEYSIDTDRKAENGLWTQLRSSDFGDYDRLEFWVKGDAKKGYTTTFKVEFKKFKDFPGDEPGTTRTETIKGSFVVTGVTDRWQKISVPLNKMNGILEWSEIREFVISFEKRRVDAKKGVLYFDDLTFVDTGDFGPRVTDIVHHRRKKTEKDLSPVEFAKFLIDRLYGFPKRVVLSKRFPSDDKKFLMEIAKDTWKYFENAVDKEYNLPLDNIGFGEDVTVSEETRVGDYTNITNVGLYLMCVVGGYDLGFISREEAIERIDGTLDSLKKMAKYKGFPFNYYDITIFQETSNFVSLVDSGWLVAGMIVARNAFPEVEPKCTELIDQMDFSMLYDPVSGHMYHGYYININYYSEYLYGAFYTEPRAISYIAIGKGDVPAEHWFMLARVFPDTWVWQTQLPKGTGVKNYLGYDTETGYYVYDGIKYVPSWGGSMFEALMPTIILDEKNMAPKGLGLNDKRHAEIQVSYTKNVLEYPVWGMSPCCVPEGGYSEYGVKPLGMKGYKPGVVTPHATFLALEFVPEEAVKNLRKMLEIYDNIYGEYGFYDAVNVKTGKVATKYLCLDQGMSFLALVNYLNDGSIRKRFHQDPISQKAQQLLIIEEFFE
jgi:hypothetical protein